MVVVCPQRQDEAVQLNPDVVTWKCNVMMSRVSINTLWSPVQHPAIVYIAQQRCDESKREPCQARNT